MSRHKWKAQQRADEEQCGKCGLKRTETANKRTGRLYWVYWHHGAAHPLAGPCKAFPCCGGTDESPANHTQDCPGEPK